MNTPSQWIHLQLASLPEALCKTQGPLPANIHLREVDQAVDLPQVAALYNMAFAHEDNDVAALSPEELARLVWHPGLNPKVAVLALDGDQVVGLGVASTGETDAGTGSRRGAVELLAVRSDYQKRGIGRALLHAVLGWLAGRKATIIGATVNQPKPLAIMQRYGFVPTPAGEQEA